MNVRDHKSHHRPRRVSWLLVVLLSFTAGVLAAATLFAYTSRIPIPLKLAPTRSVDDLLSRQEKDAEGSDLRFQDRLEDRVVGTGRIPVESHPGSPRNLPQKPSAVAVPVPAVAVELAYFVQAGAFADAAAATKLSGELGSMGVPVGVRAAKAGDGMHLVILGPFPAAAAAETIRAQLALQGRTTQLLRLAPDG